MKFNTATAWLPLMAVEPAPIDARHMRFSIEHVDRIDFALAQDMMRRALSRGGQIDRAKERPDLFRRVDQT